MEVQTWQPWRDGNAGCLEAGDRGGLQGKMLWVSFFCSSVTCNTCWFSALEVLHLHSFSGHQWQPQGITYGDALEKQQAQARTHVCRVTKWQSWVCQFMVPSHALKHAEKTMWGWRSRQRLAGSYVGPSPSEQILPLQTCTWFLSSPSTGLDLTEFPIAHVRRRNIFPTATNSLWQAVARISLGFQQTISWLVACLVKEAVLC